MLEPIIQINYKAPGPGAYRSFSEFGIYESKNAGQSPAKSQTKE